MASVSWGWCVCMMPDLCVLSAQAQVWDPVLIVFQIVALQCLFYLGLGLWHVLLLGECR